MKIRVVVEGGFCNDCIEIEVEDSATDIEIEEAIADEVLNYIEWYWEEI